MSWAETYPALLTLEFEKEMILKTRLEVDSERSHILDQHLSSTTDQIVKQSSFCNWARTDTLTLLVRGTVKLK